MAFSTKKKHKRIYTYIYIYIFTYIYIYIYISPTVPQAQLRVQCPHRALYPVLQFSSPPVFQSSRFPDPVPVGVGVWSRSLETHSGESILRGVQGGPGRAPAWIPTPQEEALAPKFAYLASSWRSCAPSWRQDATTSPKISKKTPSWSQHLPT